MDEDKEKNPIVINKIFDPTDETTKYKVRYFYTCFHCGNKKSKDKFINVTPEEKEHK